MASHGIKDRVAIVGMGCTNFVEHWDKGLDDLVIEAANDAYASAGIDKNDVDAYWLGTAQGGMSGITLARPLAARRQAGHPGRELLRHRRRVAAPGRLRGGVGRVRHRDGDRGREDQGRWLPGAQRGAAAERRHRPHPHRGRDVLDGRPRVRGEVRRRRRQDARGDGARRLEEPPQRRAQLTGAVPARGVDRDDLQFAEDGRRSRACSTAPASPTARPPPSSCGRRTPTSTPTPRSS